MRMLVLHRACDTPIYIVDRVLQPGDEIRAAEWHPLSAEWPAPVSGEAAVCPNCQRYLNFDSPGQEFLVTPVDWPSEAVAEPDDDSQEGSA